MQKWEYMTVGYFVNNNYQFVIKMINDQAVKEEIERFTYYNELGKQGWELVTVSAGAAYFKRPKQ
jgi:hypothetical protein